MQLCCREKPGDSLLNYSLSSGFFVELYLSLVTQFKLSELSLKFV